MMKLQPTTVSVRYRGGDKICDALRLIAWAREATANEKMVREMGEQFVSPKARADMLLVADGWADDARRLRADAEGLALPVEDDPAPATDPCYCGSCAPGDAQAHAPRL